MTEAGRSLKNFYLVLGAVALVGIVLIVRAATTRPAPPLVEADCSGPPLGAAVAQAHTLGPDSAPLQVTEYADFECPACARFAIVTMPDVIQRLIPSGKLRWSWMDYPLGQHVNSPIAHVAAACAADQGRFWEMEYALYSHQDDWFEAKNPESKIRDYAKSIGLQADSFRVCLTERRHWATIQANRCTGAKLAIDGTPTFFLNGRRLGDTPAFDDLSRLIDSVGAKSPARGR